LVSNTFENAAQSLETIKEEVKNNEELNRAYVIKIVQDSFGKCILDVSGKQVLVRCWGEEQIPKMRGTKFGAYRPNLIVVDDLENDELVRSPERRRNLKDNFDSALLPCVDIYHKIRVIGTNLHDDSLMSKIVLSNGGEYAGFVTLFYKALIDEDKATERSLWPERWSVEDLRKLKEANPEKFAKEYQNDPVYGTMGNFMKEDFRYWRIENMDYVLFGYDGEIVGRGALSDCKAAVGIDLAWEEKKRDDYSAVIPGFLTPNNDVLIDTYLCKKGLRPNELEEYLFTLVPRLESITGGIVPIGMEKAKLEKVMKWFLKQAMRRRKKTLVLKDIKWESDKISRIVTTLQPFYTNHMLYHKKGMHQLEDQLLRVPSGTHDDLPDAEHILVKLLKDPKKVTKVEEEKFNMWEYLTRRDNDRLNSKSVFYVKRESQQKDSLTFVK
jgi:hypothetical protein